jgi:MFS family permease
MKEQKPKTLSKEQIEKTKKASIIDGSAFNVMYGFGEQYVTPYALKLGATNSEIGILSSVPAFIGAISQVWGAKLTDDYQNRKKIVLWCVFLQAVSLLPLFIIPLLTNSMLLLTIIFSLYLIFANMGGPAWNSWIGDVISKDDRSRYFAKRNKIAIAFLLFSVMSAGIILNFFASFDIWTGFAILFVIAFLGRLISLYALSKQYEPQYEFKKESYFSFKDFLKRMPETNFGNFVIFRSLIAFAVMIGSPFFAVYMLNDLEFSYIQYTAVVLAPMVIKILTMTYWGKNSERWGNKNIMFVSAFWIALTPFWWFISGFFLEGTLIFYFLLLSESITGFAWAGFELTTFNYMLETSKPEKRARAFAYFNVIFGTFVMIGGLLGAFLIKYIKDIDFFGTVIPAILLVFLISSLVRALVAASFVQKINEVRVNESMDKKMFLDLVVAKPLNTALSHTNYTLNLANEEIDKIRKTTKKALNTITKPVQPLINEVIEFVDDSLQKAEPIRKSIEPDSIRKAKKQDYEHLTGQDYSEYIKTHPKIIRHIYKKSKRRR